MFTWIFVQKSLVNKFMNACYGLSLPRKLWVMGYKGFMGYVGDFPASQLGRWDFLWAMGGYGLREVWVIRVSTVSVTPHFAFAKGMDTDRGLVYQMI